jgi:hypothetical protein
MFRKKFGVLEPKKVLERMKNVPIIMVIGPTSSGKSTLIYILLNHRIIKFVRQGIGEKKQTTIIPCNFVFDERIDSSNVFALQLKKKTFEAKKVHLYILEKLAELFVSNGMEIDDTLESIDKNFVESILEPEDKSYHLGRINEEISIEEWKAIMRLLLEEIGEANPSFKERVDEKKKMYGTQKKNIREIRKLVFQDICDSLDEENSNWKKYYEWLKSIGKIVTDRLLNVMGVNELTDEIFQFRIDELENEKGNYSVGGNILNSLFDPFESHSLIVEEMTIACQPREDLIDENSKIPLRFCLRDTMGLNQIESEESYIKEALDVALGRTPDSIMLLLNLEERDKTLAMSCKAVRDKLEQLGTKNIPLDVILTKADRIIESKINKADRNALELSQEDYNAHIEEAIGELDDSLRMYEEMFPKSTVNWISLRLIAQNDDMIQKALTALKDDSNKEKFSAKGVFKLVNSVVNKSQVKYLPKNIKNPIFLTVEDNSTNAIKISISMSKIMDIIEFIQNKLTQDKEYLNGYQVTTQKPIHGKTVVCYYNNLTKGKGYTSQAKIYGNISINMKGMLNKVINESELNIMKLYDTGALSVTLAKLKAENVNQAIKVLDPSGSIRKAAEKDINPEIVNKWGDVEHQKQFFYTFYKDFFSTPVICNTVIEWLASRLAYTNPEIREIVDRDYNWPISYNATIRKMQDDYKKIFAIPEFERIFAEEFGNVLTEYANKIFIII